MLEDDKLILVGSCVLKCGGGGGGASWCDGCGGGGAT